MSTWSYVDVWRTVGEAQPDAVAIESGDVVVTWSEFVDQMDALGSYFAGLGLPRQSTVAAYLYNCPEYLVTFAGTLAAGFVPINTNYRYGHDELAYLFDNADTKVIVFHGTFTDKIDALRSQLPHVVAYLHVDDGTSPCPPWATDFQVALSTSPTELPPSSPDDLVMLYTGGTTGMPKGVMWRQDDLFVRLNSGGFRKYPEEGGLADVRRFIEEAGAGYTLLPACPLMHGTGLFTAIRALGEAGRVVLLQSRHLDPVELASTLQDYDVNVAVIVGEQYTDALAAVADSLLDGDATSRNEFRRVQARAGDLMALVGYMVAVVAQRYARYRQRQQDLQAGLVVPAPVAKAQGLPVRAAWLLAQQLKIGREGRAGLGPRPHHARQQAARAQHAGQLGHDRVGVVHQHQGQMAHHGGQARVRQRQGLGAGPQQRDVRPQPLPGGAQLVGAQVHAHPGPGHALRISQQPRQQGHFGNFFACHRLFFLFNQSR